MRSAMLDYHSPRPSNGPSEKLGRDIALARRKRGLTVQMVTERVGVSRGTYLRIEKGDPSVAVGVYAMAFFVFGLGTPPRRPTRPEPR